MLELASGPIAAKPAPITASAASASISVKPAIPRRSGFARRHNFDASGQPVDANLISDPLPRDRYDASARLAARKEIDRRADEPVAAALRQQRLKAHVGGNFDDRRRRSGNDDSLLGVERCRNLRMAADRGVAVALQESGDLDRVAGEPLLRGGARNRRQDERGQKPDDRQHADGFDQRESGLCVASRHYRDALLIRLWELPSPPDP